MFSIPQVEDAQEEARQLRVRILQRDDDIAVAEVAAEERGRTEATAALQVTITAASEERVRRDPAASDDGNRLFLQQVTNGALAADASACA